MKYSCSVVKDLLPLYHDNVCSEASRAIVEEHLLECDACKNEMGKIDNEIYDIDLQKEKEDVVERYTKKFKRKSMLVGVALSGVLGIPVLVCLIVNIATGNALDWFFIVLASIMVAASVTVVPLIAETKRGLLTLGSFTGSTLLLLAVICIYTHGNWFFIPAFSILLAMSICFLPYVLNQLPLSGFFKENKGLISIVADVVLLYLLIAIIGLYARNTDYWRIALQVTTICVLFAAGIFAIIRYMKVNGFTKAGICILAFGFFSVLINDVIDWLLAGFWHFRIADANLLYWNNNTVINANSGLLGLLSCGVMGVIFLLVGRYRKCILSSRNPNNAE